MDLLVYRFIAVLNDLLGNMLCGLTFWAKLGLRFPVVSYLLVREWNCQINEIATGFDSDYKYILLGASTSVEPCSEYVPEQEKCSIFIWNELGNISIRILQVAAYARSSKIIMYVLRLLFMSESNVTPCPS